MTVKSTKPFIGVSSDHPDNFKGKQLMYTSWDRHMLFAAPLLHCVEPDLRFKEYIDDVLSPLLVADPDAEKIRWPDVKWIKNGKAWAPDFDATLAENGIVHKEQLRFQTPGLNTVCASV